MQVDVQIRPERRRQPQLVCCMRPIKGLLRSRPKSQLRTVHINIGHILLPEDTRQEDWQVQSAAGYMDVVICIDANIWQT